MSYISDLSIAVICSSNMNRSMEAHGFLAKKGYKVRSFGTGEKVKLPGTALDKPNVYEFGAFTYDEIYNDLANKDKQYYTQNGLLHMLDRNRRIKKCPEKFQHCTEQFDLIITAEERVYDQVVEFMESKAPVTNKPVHIINIDIQDNHEEATMGAFLICDLVAMLTSTEDLGKFTSSMPFGLTSSKHMKPILTNFTIPIDNDIDELLHEFEASSQRSLLHCVLFY